MKKLLNLLAVSALVTSTTVTMVHVKSCSVKDEKIFKKPKAPENRGNELEFTKDFQTSYKTENDVIRQKINGTPFGKYWMPEGQNASEIFPDEPEEIINSFYQYNPQSDKDAKYNVASVSLNERFNTRGSNNLQDKTGKVKHHAMGVVNRSTSGTPAQGSSLFDNYNFTNWQYVDEYTAWAGANNEGIIVLPTADIIDAAHINGTKMLGIIYFDGYFGLTPELLKNFFKKDDAGNYLIVDKLIEVAHHFGFDGWFWNNEANATEGILDDDDVIGVMTQYKEKVSLLNYNQIMVGYQDHAGHGPYGKNKSMAEKYAEISDSYIEDFFSNTGSEPKFTDAFIEKNNLENKRYDQYIMENINKVWSTVEKGDYPFKNNAGYKKNGDTYQYTNSYASFAMADTYKNFVNDNQTTINKNQQFHKNDLALFSGKHGDPSQQQTDNGTGISSTILERSPIQSEEFITNFSTGQGVGFWENGKNIGKDVMWNHRGVMDIQPTFQWKVENKNQDGLIVDYDYKKAFEKGNSIAITSKNYNSEKETYDGANFKANGSTLVNLYETNSKITNQKMNFKLSAQTDTVPVISNFEFKAVLDFQNAGKQELVLEDKTFIEDSEGWYDFEVDLSKFKDDTLKNISLKVESSKTTNNLKINLGEIKFLKNKKKTKNKFVADLNYEYVIDMDDSANIRLYWDKVKDSEIDRYELYQYNSDGTQTFLGTTRTSGFFIENIDKTKGLKIGIKVVSKYNNVNKKTTIREIG